MSGPDKCTNGIEVVNLLNRIVKFSYVELKVVIFRLFS